MIKNKITASPILLSFYITFVPILPVSLFHLLTLSSNNFFLLCFLKLLVLLLPILIFLPFLVFSLYTNNIPSILFHFSHPLFSCQFSSPFLPIYVFYHPDYFIFSFIFIASCYLCILYLFLNFLSFVSIS
jgi:hypothetical protein